MQERGVIERECVVETGTTTRTRRGRRRGTARLQGGGYVAPLRAVALRARHRRQVELPRFPQVGGTRRNAASMVAPAKGPVPSSVPGILSPRKITFKGAPSGRVCDGAKTAPPLSGIFPGKTIGTYRIDGADRAPPTPRLRKECQAPLDSVLAHVSFLGGTVE